MSREREILLLTIGISASVTLPFAWFIAARYGAFWGVVYAAVFSYAAAWLLWSFLPKGRE